MSGPPDDDTIPVTITVAGLGVKAGVRFLTTDWLLELARYPRDLLDASLRPQLNQALDRWLDEVAKNDFKYPTPSQETPE